MRFLLLSLLLCFSYGCTNSIKPKLPSFNSERPSDKELEINDYMQHEWELTHDPALGRIPSERLISAKKILKERSSFRTNTRKEKSSWNSVGPANIGGRTR